MYGAVADAEGGLQGVPLPRAPASKQRRVLVFGAVVTVSLLGVAGLATRRTQGPASVELAARPFTSGAKKQGWYIYKAAWAGADNRTQELYDFMHKHSGGVTCANVSLGCGGYKITCNYGEDRRGVSIDKQLHYVVADRLPSQAVDGDKLGVNGWTQETMEDMGNMNEFTAMMHNKVQLFVLDIGTQIERLQADGYNVLLRRSNARSGESVAHVLVPVGGVVWEFFGLLDRVTSDYTFPYWTEEECPNAHIIDSNLTNMEIWMRNQYGNSSNTGDEPDLPRAYWTGISSPASDVSSDDYSTLFKHMKVVTGAIVRKTSSAYCDVVSVNYNNENEWEKGGHISEHVTLKYVTNRAKQTLRSGKTIKDFENYITRVHDRFLTQKTEPTYGADGEKSERFRGWDHWLDSHIGVKYGGANDALNASETAAFEELCFKAGEELTATLVTDDIPVGKRFVQTDGDHYYSGYSGMLMTMEYNTECHFGDHTSNICTCVPTNSDLDFLRVYGDQNVESNSSDTCDLIAYSDIKDHDTTIHGEPLPHKEEDL